MAKTNLKGINPLSTNYGDIFAFLSEHWQAPPIKESTGKQENLKNISFFKQIIEHFWQM